MQSAATGLNDPIVTSWIGGHRDRIDLIKKHRDSIDLIKKHRDSIDLIKSTGV